MKKIRVAINGFGRIGRAFYKVASQRKEIDIVAVNDLGDIDNMAYLLKYDTVYGRFETDIQIDKSGEHPVLKANGHATTFIQEKELQRLPWKDLDVDVVVESTGFFTSYEASKEHLSSGAKRVVISAPVKDEPEAAGITGATVLLGVNEDKLESSEITSNASCTTNAGTPIIAILHEALGIEKALLNTVHGYTASQALVDGPSKRGWREGRAAAQNIVPSSTGAAIATTKAVPELAGKFDGIAIRVPVPAGSIVDITFLSKKNTTAEEVNEILRKAAKSDRWENIFTTTDEDLVSSDIVGSSYGSIADLTLTRVVDGNLVKVMAWYDNEMGYTHTLVEHVVKTGSHI